MPARASPFPNSDAEDVCLSRPPSPSAYEHTPLAPTKGGVLRHLFGGLVDLLPRRPLALSRLFASGFSPSVGSRGSSPTVSCNVFFRAARSSSFTEISFAHLKVSHGGSKQVAPRCEARANAPQQSAPSPFQGRRYDAVAPFYAAHERQACRAQSPANRQASAWTMDHSVLYDVHRSPPCCAGGVGTGPRATQPLFLNCTSASFQPNSQS